eukprot:TRINITY_DN37026_c0_g1_i1.p1 TRINITY_DN37026_c0_g1~~TRINITY_DN37026_c0_g1_i1.p1  ORF type:complete len:538 (+),score=121.79 TRINITY_DN37026_c0_g1_i1:606-2219(+)
MTVKETLTFFAKLRLSQHATNIEVEARVDSILKTLDLFEVRDSLIGDTHLKRGISGGEKKRVSIGLELLCEPSVLFLDECTTGLDSFHAFEVLNSLRSLTKAGMTVIVSIHQPSSVLYEFFDKILLMANNGKVAYFGPANSAVDFLVKNCTVERIEGLDDAELLLKYVTRSELLESGSQTDNLEEESKLEMEQLPLTDSWGRGSAEIDELTSKFAETMSTKELLDAYFQMFCEGSKYQVAFLSADNFKYAANMVRQVSVLLNREFIVLKRSSRHHLLDFLFNVFLKGAIATLFLRLPLNQSGIQNRFGNLFLDCMTSTFFCLDTLSLFIVHKEIFIRERSSKLYQTVPFMCSRVIFDVFVKAFKNFCYVATYYYIVGLRPQIQYFMQHQLASCLLVFVGYSIFALLAATTNYEIANLLGPMCVGFIVIPSGFILNLNSVPVYWKWMQVISPFKYAFEAMADVEFQGRTFYCTESEYVPSGCQGSSCVCPITTGEQALSSLGLSSGVFWKNCAVLSLMFVVLTTLLTGYLKFRFKHRN